MTNSTVKRFTPHEATLTLPLVRRIVRDILATGRAMRAIATETKPSEDRVDDYDRHSSELKALFGELDDLGCQYKDWNFEIGLVDFPAVIDDEDVLLCWRSDEPHIRYYHKCEDGYAGRREIPESLLNSGHESAPDAPSHV